MEQLLCKWSELLGMVIRHTFKTHIYVGEQIGSLHLQYIISWYLWPYNILQPTNETFQNHNILNYTPNIWNIDTDTDTKQWWSRTFQDLSWSTNWETYLSKEFVKQSSWQCFVTFLGWLSDPLKWLSDLHLEIKWSLWITWFVHVGIIHKYLWWFQTHMKSIGKHGNLQLWKQQKDSNPNTLYIYI